MAGGRNRPRHRGDGRYKMDKITKAEYEKLDPKDQSAIQAEVEAGMTQIIEPVTQHDWSAGKICSCGADTYTCQKCGHEFCSVANPPTNKCLELRNVCMQCSGRGHQGPAPEHREPDLIEGLQAAGLNPIVIDKPSDIGKLPPAKRIFARLSQAQQNRVRNITIVAQTNSWMETKKLGDLLTKAINEQVLPGKVFKVSSVTTASTRPPQESRATRLANAISQIQNGLGEVESLAEELTSWKDNMADAGTGLENTDKYSRLEEAVGTLESAKDSIESAVSDLEGVEIPGMFD